MEGRGGGFIDFLPRGPVTRFVGPSCAVIGCSIPWRKDASRKMRRARENRQSCPRLFAPTFCRNNAHSGFLRTILFHVYAQKITYATSYMGKFYKI